MPASVSTSMATLKALGKSAPRAMRPWLANRHAFPQEPGWQKLEDAVEELPALGYGAGIQAKPKFLLLPEFTFWLSLPSARLALRSA